MNSITEERDKWERIYTKISEDLFSPELDIQRKALEFISNHPSPRFRNLILRKHDQVIQQQFAALFMRAAALVLKNDYFKLVADYLRNPNSHIRADCILSIQLILNDQNRHKIIITLINFLSDPDELVVMNVIKVLTENYELNEITSNLDKYLKSDDQRRHLNALYLIERMQLEDSSKILQKCFFHNDPEVRLSAKKLILRKKRSISIRDQEQSIGLEKEVELKDLIEAFHNHEMRRIIDILQNIGTKGENPEVAKFLHKILESECFDLDSFVLATAVKTLVDTSSDLVWPTLSKYLKHDDSRVIANTVEALSSQNEINLIPFLREFCDQVDVTNPSDMRIILSGISLLIQHDLKTAMLVMNKLESGELDSRILFAETLKKWTKPPLELEQLVLKFIQKETSNEMMDSCKDFINQNGSPRAISEFNRISNKFQNDKKTNDLVKNFIFDKFGISLSHKFEKFDFLDKYLSLVTKWFSTKNFGLAFILILFTLVYSFYDSSPTEVAVKPNHFINSISSSVGSNIKGRGVIIEINTAENVIEVKQNEIQYQLRFRDLSEFDKFSKGQSVKFVGQLIDRTSNPFTEIRCKYIFAEGSYSKTPSS